MTDELDSLLREHHELETIAENHNEDFDWVGFEERYKKHKELKLKISNELDEIKQLKEELDSMIKHKIEFEHAFSEARFEADNLKSENQKLKEELDIVKNNKAHIPELAFRNGKAYCKKCGSNLE